MPKVGVAPIRRREIFEAASRIVAEKGLARATIRDIAEAAKVSTGTVQYYFKSKENLLVETLSYVSDRIQARTRRAMDSADTAPERMRAVAKALLPKGADRRRDWQVWFLAWSHAAQSKALQAQIRDRMSSWDQLVISVLSEWPGGPHDPETLQQCARDLDAMLNGLLVDLIVFRRSNDPVEFERATDSLIRLIAANLER